MSAYHDLKEMLCAELEQIAKKGELSPGDLEIVDKLTHSIKSIECIIAMDTDGDYSYARTRRGYSGRYSRSGALVGRLEDVMQDAPDEQSRRDIQRLIDRMR